MIPNYLNNENRKKMKNDEISQPERNYCFPNCLMKIIMTKNAADLEKWETNAKAQVYDVIDPVLNKWSKAGGVRILRFRQNSSSKFLALSYKHDLFYKIKTSWRKNTTAVLICRFRSYHYLKEIFVAICLANNTFRLHTVIFNLRRQTFSVVVPKHFLSSVTVHML